jgi:hypothetical protein
MNIKVALFLVLASIICISAPAMADSATWTGSAASDDWMTASNWVNGYIGSSNWQLLPPGDPNAQWVNVFPDMIIGSTAVNRSITDNGSFPTVGSVYDSLPGIFTINGGGGWAGYSGNINIQPGSTLNINGLNSGNNPAPTINVPTGATLNYAGSGGALGINGATFTGGGSINLQSWNNPENGWTMTAGTIVNVSSLYGWNVDGIAGTGTVNFGAAPTCIYGGNGNTFYIMPGGVVSPTVQINVLSGALAFGTSNGTLPVTGVNVHLAGGALTTEAQPGYVAAAPQTYVSCTFTGGGEMYLSAYGQNPYYPGTTMIAQGCTLAPSFVANWSSNDGSQSGSGILDVRGALQFAKNGTTNTQVGITVANALNNGAGSSYTALRVGWTGGGTGGTIASTSSTTNALADADLVVNITPGLTPKGVLINGDPTNTANPFYGQTMNILSGLYSDLSAASFGKVTFIGGTATVNYTSAGVTLTNVWSNPTLAGDINNDGLVDVADYNIWAANVGKTGATWGQGDLNGDGLVDVADYNIWAANVGKTAATPEPISMIILAIGGGLVALKRRNV